MNESIKAVLVYTHRHGVDVSFYETEEQATLSAIDIILDWAHELDWDNQKAVLDLIVEGSFAEAQEKYECASEETLEVHGVEGAKIFPADHFDKADLKKRAEQELKKHQED